MFNIGGGEMVVIGVVALIVVGPKDLPNLFRKTGQFVGRMRVMADDFRRTMEAAADDVGANDLKKEFDDFGKDAHDFTKFNDINESAAALEAENRADIKSEKKVAAKKKVVPKVKSTATTATKTKAVVKTKTPKKTKVADQ